MAGTQDIDLDGLVAAIARRDTGSRMLIALAGPPGAGKSTLADALVARFEAREAGSAAVLPMDGYHFDDRVLIARGLHARKGAPDTFDVGGLAAMLERLRRNDEAEVAVPVFDRDIEIARAGGRLIPQSVRHLVVEGNYLLLGQAPWSGLRQHFDLTVMIAVPEVVLRQRLVARWQEQGLAPAAIAQKVDGNDLPNGRLLIAQSTGADYLLRS